MMMTLEQVQAFLLADGLQVGGVRSGANESILRVHTDSRSVQVGDLFVALVGEHFDGHEFLQQAKQQGAVAAVVQRGRAADGLPCLEVDDTLQALGALARQWRRQFSIPVIAVTGSNGKTTVTQMIASILRMAHGDKALATQGNLNNEIGVPLMVLRLRQTHRAAVFELGMNHPGEIARLASITQPTVAVVNNAQREHQEFMHTIEAVAQENGAVLTALASDGVAVFPADDTYAGIWQALAGDREKVTFGPREATVSIAKAVWGNTGWQAQLRLREQLVPATLQVLGRHHLRNAMAAAAATSAAGYEAGVITAGLEAFSPVAGRGVLHIAHHDDGTQQWIVDDTYNANPDSVRAAIDVLADMPAPRLLVLGDMGEVGEQGPQFHAEVGEYAKAKGLDALWLLGDMSRDAQTAFGAGARHFESMQSLQSALIGEAMLVASILVKGSRFMRMEHALQTVLKLDDAQSGRVCA